MTKQIRTCSLWLLFATAAACTDVDHTTTVAPETPVGIQEAALTSSTTFQRGKLGTVVDATINASFQRENFGDDAKLVVSKRNEALLRFDLASIPSNAVINSATLTLYMHGHDDGDDDNDCDDDRDDDRRGHPAVPIDIKVVTSPWVERQVTYRSFDQDFASAVVGILVPAGKNTYKSLDLKATVQQWVGGQRSNYGVVLVTNSKKRWAFASSDNSRVSLRPALTISYSTPDNHCAPNPCQHSGQCTNSWTGYTCQCPPGWTGAQCQTNIDDCSGTPCLNGGVCADGLNSYTCSCAPGFAGAQCQTNVNDCAPSPCQNGGVCSDRVNGFTCACGLGYTGATCGTVIDNCAAGPCQNGGTCTNGVGTYTCACPAGFGGSNCQINIDDCAGSPCLNGGSCVDSVNHYDCNCAAGFTGPNCQTNIDDCASHPCLNGGTCTDGVTSYACTCGAGFVGTNCEVNVDDCASHPCQHGLCVDGDASYTCACDAGYSGTNCQTDIDDCSPNPCLNGGACNDGVDSHSCDCAQGYEGANCETTCTGSNAASAVADRGAVTAPSGYEYVTPEGTATSANECPAWSCGTGVGPAAGAIDDNRATGWNSGSWDFGAGYTLTLALAAPQSFNGLHIISRAVPTDDITFTVTLVNDAGVSTTLAPETMTVLNRLPGDLNTGADIVFSSSGYHGIVSVSLFMQAPYVSSAASTWLDIDELQLIAPAGCEPPPSCPTGSSMFEGKCYAAFVDLPASSSPFNYWTWADGDCAARFAGGRLTSIGSEAESTFVRGLVPMNKGVMLNGTDDGGAANSFAWRDGAPFTYSNWAPGQPDNRTVLRFTSFLSEDWILMLQDGKWYDVPYADGSGYVCEFAQ